MGCTHPIPDYLCSVIVDELDGLGYEEARIESPAMFYCSKYVIRGTMKTNTSGKKTEVVSAKRQTCG